MRNLSRSIPAVLTAVALTTTTCERHQGHDAADESVQHDDAEPSSPGSGDDLSLEPAGAASSIDENLPTEDAETQTVGALPGTFRVTDDGVATYRIPLALPVGHPQVQPQIELQYSSAAGNGLLGVGFSLGGFSSISRCKRSIVPDGRLVAVQLDDGDNLCLDGARLQLVSGDAWSDGATYRPERDDFVRVRQIGTGDDAFFVADHPSGKRVTYGGTGSSRVLTRGVVSGWSASRVQDLFGNYITIAYASSTDEVVADGASPAVSTVDHRPDSISMWGNATEPTKAISFHYSSRTDSVVGHVNGGIRRTTHLLEHIELREPDGTHYRDYVFVYDYSPSTYRSRLLRVAECSANGSACTPATSFLWSDAPQQLYAAEQTDDFAFAGEPWPNVDGHGENGGVPANTNGDGNDDLVFLEEESNTWQVWHGGPSGEQVDTVIESPANFYLLNPMRFRGNVDNDGAEDLLVLDEHLSLDNPSTWDPPEYLTMLMGTQDGLAKLESTFGPAHDLDVPILDENYEWRAQWTAADFSGDGLLDLAICHAVEDEPGSSMWSFYYADGDRGWIREHTAQHGSCARDEFTVLDFDGDKAANLILLRHPDGVVPPFTEEEYTALVKTPWDLWVDAPTGLPAGVLGRILVGGGPETPGRFRGGRSADIVIDLNGDELPDIVRFELPDGDTEENLQNPVTFDGVLVAYLSTGAGFRRSIQLWPQPPNVVAFWQVQSSFPFDVDMDGTQELVVPEIVDGVGQGWLGVGLRPSEDAPEVLEAVERPTGLPLTDLYYNPGMSIIGPFDWNGDGLSDFLVRNGVVEPWTRQGERPDLLQRITDGYGARTEIEYAPLRWVHTTDTSACEYPVQCTNDSRPVVRYEDHDLGIDAEFTSQRIEHAYVDGRTHRLGRGWLGFAEHSSSPKEGDNDPGVDVLTRTRMDNQTYDEDVQDFPFAHRASRVIRESEVIAGRRHVLDEQTSLEVKRPEELLTWFVVPEEQRIRAYEIPSVDACSPDFSGCMIDPSTLDSSLPYRDTLKTYEHDERGNLEFLTVDHGGGRIDEVEKSYLDSADEPYFLGRVRGRIERSTANGATKVRTSSFSYDLKTGALSGSVVEPGNPQLQLKTELARDGYGNVWHNVVTDPLGNSREMVVAADALGVFPQNLLNSLDHLDQRIYSYRTGALRRSIDPNGVVTDNTYDQLGRRVRSERFAGLGGPSQGIVDTVLYERTSPGNWTNPSTVRQIQSTAGHHYELTELDRRGRWIRRVTKEVGDGDVEQRQTYDVVGLPASTTIPTPVGVASPGATVYKHDALRRLTSQTSPDGATTQIDYPSALQRRVFDPAGRPTTYVENSLGEIVSTTDSSGTRTCFAYGPFATLLEVRRGCTSNTAHWSTATYDAYGRRMTARDPDRGNLGYGYNAFGELTATVDGRGATSYQYDALGRTIKRTDIDGVTDWVWDRVDGIGYVGKLLKDRSPDGIANQFTYDVFGRVIAHNRKDGGTTLAMGVEYDAFSRPAVVRLPTSFGVALDVERLFDAWGHLVGVRDRNSLYGFWELTDTHPAGMPEEEQLGNGLVTSRLYDPLSLRPASIVTSDMLGGFDVQGLVYEFNLDGTLDYRGDAVGTQEESFTYDALGRLDTATASRLGVSVVRDNDYNAFGNLTARTGVGSYVYGDATRPDRLTKLAGKTIGYDPVGNITDRGGTLSVTYTAFDVPRQVTAGGVVTGYAYDAFGAMARRTSSADGSTTRYLDDYEVRRWGGVLNTQEHRYAIRAGGRVVAEVVRSNAAEAGVPGPGGYVERKRYFHDDHLGSLEAITDEVGAVVQRVSFEGFGRPRDPIWTNVLLPPPAIPSPLVGFTGVRGPMDGGLVPMPRRWYDPWMARFLGPDPLIVDPHTPLGQNRYAYAWNQPLSVTDRSGLAPAPEGDSGSGEDGAIHRTVIVPARDRGNWVGDVWQELDHGLQYAWDRAQLATQGQSGFFDTAGAVAGVLATEGFAWATLGLDNFNNLYSGVGDAIIPGLEHVREAAVPGVTNYESGAYKAGIVTGITISLTVSVAQAALAIRTAMAIARTEQVLQAAKAVGQTTKVAGPAGPAIATPTAATAAHTAKNAIGATGKIGEDALRELGGRSQVYFKTSLGARFTDQLVNAVAHEAKVGYASMTKLITSQVAKDSELLATGRVEGVVWHFFQSPTTGVGGPSGPLRVALEKAWIEIMIH